MKFKQNFYLVVFILALLLSNCARRGRPTGGLKDSIPPILVHAIPQQNTLNFKATKIKFLFDEFIKLKDVNKQLVISPPLNVAPIITPTGTASKIITIKLNDSLKPNTTYTFNFGNSVQDNNEGNKLAQFKYVFSTGTYIDSLKLSGNISNAFDDKKLTDISVLLYPKDSTFTDSIIFKEKPLYVTSTLDSTIFNFTNLKAGNYLLVAIKQKNNNYIYNPKQDKIAFEESTVTLPTDSTFTLSLFKEIPPFKLSKPIESKKGHIIFGFEGKADSLNIKLLTKTAEDFKSIAVFEKGKDTLNYWYTNNDIDSLVFDVTNGQFKKEVGVKLRLSKVDTLAIKRLTPSFIGMDEDFVLNSSIPITQIDSSKIHLLDKDSLVIPFKIKLDSYKTNLAFQFKKEYDKKYTLELLPNAFSDIFGKENDTLTYKFSTKKLEDFGTINLSVSNVKMPTIIELLSDKNEVVQRITITSDKKLTFNNLLPKKYKLRAIFDKNNNGLWDTGNYLLKIQPERVEYFSKILELRANWELNEAFILN